MKQQIICLLILSIGMVSKAQNSAHFIIKEQESKEPLPGATAIVNGKKGAVTDSAGVLVLNNIPPGKLAIEFRHVGFQPLIDTFEFPLSSNQPVQILLQREEQELDEVMVTSTRVSRSIKNIPTRIELVEEEEIDEKSNMRPANISMLLHESTGIQVQQTSATSANASIRIQGLDGRYTQLLKDGYPNYGGFAGGLSILEIPPLDLKQVEVIKGPASTLYGGGAIAGVVNLVSKEPQRKRELNMIFNQSHIGQTNLGVFYSQRFNKTGFTFFGSVNGQKAYDVDKDDFTELPKTWDITLHPRIFFYINPATTLSIGNSFTKSERKGGDIVVVKGNANSEHTYFEENNTLRNTTTLQIDKKLSEHEKLVVKQAISFYDRKIAVPLYRFAGKNLNSFSEVSWVKKTARHDIATGANFIYDAFNENSSYSGMKRDATTITGGAFLQDTWDISKIFGLETGLRADAVNYRFDNYQKTELFLLPRVSGLFKWNSSLSSRISMGMGYKAPTLFTEETETIQYQGIAQLKDVKSEKSYGGTADINYRVTTGEWSIGINQLFFYTLIDKPLILVSDGSPFLSFENVSRPVHSFGTETNLRVVFHDFKLFAGYTHTKTKAAYKQSSVKDLPLVPRNRLNLALIYEKERDLKIGLEGYYTSPQYRSDLSLTPSYWELGFMAEKTIRNFSIFVNFENLTDVRQSRYEKVPIPPHDNPTFKEIWTHVEGFVFNAGVKVKL